MRFEYFLTLLNHSEFIIGNSSAGIREAGIYGIPTIDLGIRQTGRYNPRNSRRITHIEEKSELIKKAIDNQSGERVFSHEFGDGKSDEKFIDILDKGDIWNVEIQKRFIDYKFIGETANV